MGGCRIYNYKMNAPVFLAAARMITWTVEGSTRHAVTSPGGSGKLYRLILAGMGS